MNIEEVIVFTDIFGENIDVLVHELPKGGPVSDIHNKYPSYEDLWEDFV